MPTFSSPGALRRALLPLLVTSVTVIAACSGLTSIDASFENVTDTVAFYPLNGSLPGAPTAMAFFNLIPTHADQGFAYDIAFDVNASGKVVLIPPRQLASQLANPYSVGLQTVTGTFAALTRAPKEGYTVDSLLVVSPGTVVAIESHDVVRCGFAIKGQSYFSKLIVDSIVGAERRIFTTLTVNRNCGFYSFADGKPKD
jgi:hypothetical protein